VTVIEGTDLPCDPASGYNSCLLFEHPLSGAFLRVGRRVFIFTARSPCLHAHRSL